MSTKLDGADLESFIIEAARQAGIGIDKVPEPGLEVVQRASDTAVFTFLINHTDLDITHPSTGIDLFTCIKAESAVPVPAHASRVVRRDIL